MNIQQINSPTRTVVQNESFSGGVGLAQFLIDRACKNDAIANYFYWYLIVECEEMVRTKHSNLSAAARHHATQLQPHANEGN